jgi:hypothetical protein
MAELLAEKLDSGENVHHEANERTRLDRHLVGIRTKLFVASRKASLQTEVSRIGTGIGEGQTCAVPIADRLGKNDIAAAIVAHVQTVETEEGIATRQAPRVFRTSCATDTAFAVVPAGNQRTEGIEAAIFRFETDVTADLERRRPVATNDDGLLTLRDNEVTLGDRSATDETFQERPARLQLGDILGHVGDSGESTVRVGTRSVCLLFDLILTSRGAIGFGLESLIESAELFRMASECRIEGIDLLRNLANLFHGLVRRGLRRSDRSRVVDLPTLSLDGSRGRGHCARKLNGRSRGLRSLAVNRRLLASMTCRFELLGYEVLHVVGLHDLLLRATSDGVEVVIGREHVRARRVVHAALANGRRTRVPILHPLLDRGLVGRIDLEGLQVREVGGHRVAAVAVLVDVVVPNLGGLGLAVGIVVIAVVAALGIRRGHATDRGNDIPTVAIVVDTERCALAEGGGREHDQRRQCDAEGQNTLVHENSLLGQRPVRWGNCFPSGCRAWEQFPALLTSPRGG